MYEPCICHTESKMCVLVCEKRKIGVSVDVGKRETEKKDEGESSEALATHRSWFSPQGFFYTLVLISLTNNLPGGLSVRT